MIEGGAPFCFYFWQKIISPHMSELAVSLADLGHDVTYVFEVGMSEERKGLGWSVPDLPGVRLKEAGSFDVVRSIVNTASPLTVHLCQGVRGNGYIGFAQKMLASRNARQLVMMETVDDSGFRGLIKRFEYRRLFSLRLASINAILAVGRTTSDWLFRRGVPKSKIFPFSYFLPPDDVEVDAYCHSDGKFNFVFVGQFIPRKRLDLLIDALSFEECSAATLTVIGSGAEEEELRVHAQAKLGDRVKWVGKLSPELVRDALRKADCLVLPSTHDGWGAVVSESLMVGTQVVCSDACGASAVVPCLGFGGRFRRGSVTSLVDMLSYVIKKGQLQRSDREAIKRWAQCLSAPFGAEYVVAITSFLFEGADRPAPPWDGR